MNYKSDELLAADKALATSERHLYTAKKVEAIMMLFSSFLIEII